jgi:chemotaxis protein histidine kinase CheA
MQSGFLDFDSFSEIALGMERIGTALRDEQIPLSDELMALLDEARLVLDKAIEQLRNYDVSAMDLGNLPTRLA